MGWLSSKGKGQFFGLNLGHPTVTNEDFCDAALPKVLWAVFVVVVVVRSWSEVVEKVIRLGHITKILWIIGNV